jgi:predicted DNA binding CopG/RHH family protein
MVVTRMVLSDIMPRPRTVDTTGKSTGTRRIDVRVTDSQYEKLRKRAERAGITVSQLVRQVLV